MAQSIVLSIKAYCCNPYSSQGEMLYRINIESTLNFENFLISWTKSGRFDVDSTNRRKIDLSVLTGIFTVGKHENMKTLQANLPIFCKTTTTTKTWLNYYQSHAVKLLYTLATCARYLYPVSPPDLSATPRQATPRHALAVEDAERGR